MKRDNRYKTKEQIWGQDKLHQQGSTRLRGYSHAEMKSFNIDKSKCWNCNKPTIVEVMHLKAAGDFLDDSLVGEINHPNNLFCGCKSCHSYFDKPKFKDVEWLYHKKEVFVKALEWSKRNKHWVDSFENFKSPINFLEEIDKISAEIARRDKFFDVYGGSSHLENPFSKYKKSNELLLKIRRSTKKEALVEPRGGSQYHSIREHARAEAYKHKFTNKCMVSGCTNNHSTPEISHLYDIPEWPADTPLGIINHPINLRALCRYHNHEFDNQKNIDSKDYDSLLNRLNTGWEKFVQENKFNYKIINKVKYVYNKMNPLRYHIIEPKDIGNEKGFWEETKEQYLGEVGR